MLTKHLIESDFIVIGAGVVGLAIAERLSRIKNTTTLLLERNSKFGMETSGRNSEVIHGKFFFLIAYKRKAYSTTIKNKLIVQ
jgi:L-2-hydroxyglutarate oxidase LhgO